MLYVSGYIQDALTLQGTSQPGAILLAKPFTQKGLARILRQVLDSWARSRSSSFPPPPSARPTIRTGLSTDLQLSSHHLDPIQKRLAGRAPLHAVALAGALAVVYRR